MTNAAKAISWSALVGLTLVPPILFATGAINESALKWLMLAGTVIWFIATPIWVKRDPS
ncbi:hypothetical protein OAG85_01335 [Verrucomicrobiales bacterium]|nr:hypothetical protein [Verrucomicrobiales bacterium]